MVTEIMDWLSAAGNAVLAIPIILATWGICIFFDCFAEDDDGHLEERDNDRY